LFTPLMISESVLPRSGLFGETYHSPEGGPGLALIGVATLGALALCSRALRRTTRLAPSERRALLVSLAIYAALGVESLLSSHRLVPLPGLVEFAPIAVVIATSYLAANRERRLERELESSIDDQSARLLASEERYRLLVERAPIGVSVCDQRGNVLAMTERFKAILGLNEAGGSVPKNLIADAPPLVAAGVRNFAGALASGETVSGELPFTTRGGRRVGLRVVIAPQRNASGEPDGALILAEDVTEQRAIGKRLRQSLKLQAIGELVSGIATGVTLPMGALRENLAALAQGFDTLRKNTPHEAAQAERFAAIEELLAESSEGVERAIAIVRDMSDLSRGGSPTRDPVDLNELLAGVVRMAATHRRGEVAITERYAATPRVRGNVGQIRQVFLNLVVNALQAVGERGRIEVESCVLGKGVSVQVRDDGTGIAREHRDRLFVPFFTTKPAGEGTGLGLYISYQIVRAHGGEIRGESPAGGGSVFSVWLPFELDGAGSGP
jgi:two-component system NtrC family sensor kinase